MRDTAIEHRHAVERGRRAGVAETEAASVRVARMLEHLAAAERHLAEALEVAGAVLEQGDCERVEGLPADLLLANEIGMTGADRAMFLTAAQVLPDLPTVFALLRSGRLSWSQARAIVTRTRRLSRTQRARLDARLAATAERWDGLDAHGPDGLIDAVDRAVDELTDPRAAERREQRRLGSAFTVIQPTFFGGVRWYGGTDDPTEAATVLNALDRAADTPRRDDHRADDEPPSRAKQLGRALVDLCARSLDGHTADGHRIPARPRFDVAVQLDQVTVTAAGTVVLDVPGPLPHLTARLVDALATDADLRAVLFDGARPLAASRLLRADRVPDAIRTAVRLRDRGDRTPGSQRPAGWADVHHVHHRADGGDHHPDRLVLLDRRAGHRPLHDHGWRAQLDPATGMLTMRRGDRTYRSLPRGTPLEPAPPDHRAPPGPARSRPPRDRSPTPRTHPAPQLPF